MFRLKHLQIDTLSEHVIFIHEEAVRAPIISMPVGGERVLSIFDMKTSRSHG